MTSDTSSQAPDSFLALARRLSLLDDEAVRALVAEERQSGLTAAQLALKHGLLDAVQVDIIETLQAPDDAVPGFRILDLIGQGGMGVVFRARQKSLDRIVAIKTILVSQMHDQTALARFEQEALAVARLRHPNIVAAFDLGRSQNRLYFVMELLEGEDVERVIHSRGARDEATAWGIIRQAAAGLSHAAAAGIIHRDVKPANLLLVEPPAGFEVPGGLKMVKITDFGLAYLARDAEAKTRLTSANAAIGSPHYIAPEQLDGDEFDHRVDIYSLGATAYHLVTGEPPFHAKKLSQVIAQKLSADAIDTRSQFPSVSADTAELIRKMTQRDPSRRLGSYAELLAEIDRRAPPIAKAAFGRAERAIAPTTIIRSDPTPEELSRTMIPPPQARRKISRRGFIWIAGGVTGAAGLAAAAAWRIRGEQTARPRRTLVPAGGELNLFTGLSLAGWRAQSGAWVVKKNEEGGNVLSGSDGVISHDILEHTQFKSAPLRNIRVVVIVQLRDARAAGLEFAIDTSTRRSGQRYVVQIAAEGASFGRRTDDEGPFLPEAPPRRLTRRATDPYVLVIERQPGSWWLFLDDSQLGVLPAQSRPEAPEIRLRAEGGEAYFSDITLQPLDAPAQAGE